jgi:hypothetical protein
MNPIWKNSLFFISLFIISLSLVLGCKKDSEKTVEKKREILLNKRYLNIPAQSDAPKQKLSLVIDGKTVREMYTLFGRFSETIRAV